MAIYRVVVFDCITLYILRFSECYSGVQHLSSCFRHLLVQKRTQKWRKWDQKLIKMDQKLFKMDHKEIQNWDQI